MTAHGADQTAQTHIFLDFDGTLVDLAPRPDLVVVPDDLPPLVDALHQHLGDALTILTGRSVSDIEGFLPSFKGTIIGGHGAEARRDGTFLPHPSAGQSTTKTMLARMQADAAENGLLFEEKQAGGVVHFRENPEREDHARSIVASAIEDANGFVLHPAKMAFEARPADADKGSALRKEVARLGRQAAPLMIGDDETDEAAMKVAIDLSGSAIKVGDGNSIATTRLADPAAVRAWLNSWLAKVAA